MNKERIISILFIITLLVLFSLNFTKITKEKRKSKLMDEIPIAYKMPNPYLKPEKKEIIDKIPSVVSDKTIYLTFDDGPTYLTETILNTLKDENVPATFFVIGTNIDKYKDIVKRAYSEGHTIAIHTYTHKYNEIYASDENYWNDLNKINNKIYDITGHHSHIVRLPGGSSNNVSKHYNKGIMTRITENLIKNNYYYFDWNIDSSDASGNIPKEQIYDNTIKMLHYKSNIILMHDAATKKTTTEALPNIIKYAKANGYTFSRITKDTEPIRHSVNN